MSDDRYYDDKEIADIVGQIRSERRPSRLDQDPFTYTLLDGSQEAEQNRTFEEED